MFTLSLPVENEKSFNQSIFGIFEWYFHFERQINIDSISSCDQYWALKLANFNPVLRVTVASFLKFLKDNP